MPGWLFKKVQNARVYMCIKEVKRYLEMADTIRRAAIIVVAQLTRCEALDDAHIPAHAFDHPLDYPRDNLFRFYEMFETVLL